MALVVCISFDRRLTVGCGHFYLFFSRGGLLAFNKIREHCWEIKSSICATGNNLRYGHISIFRSEKSLLSSQILSSFMPPAAGRTSHRTRVCLHTKLHYLSHTSSHALSHWTATEVLVLRPMLSMAGKDNTALTVHLYECILSQASSEVMKVVFLGEVHSAAQPHP